MKKKTSLSGIRPTGAAHIGNLLGMIEPALSLQQEYSCIYFIADLHSLTTSKDPVKLRDWTDDLVATWLALGLDTSEHILFKQSDVPLVTELAWYLSSVINMGFLEKGHAYKDARATGREVNHAVFAYPVLMAADILLYDSDVVPVGKDQKQHVEMARDMAGSFNSIYGDVIKLPDIVIKEDVMVIPGLDGRKMSKSYNNYIPVFSTEKQLKKKILAIVTDSTPLEEPKSMKGTLLEDFFKLFGTADLINDLESRLQTGGLGWGHAKLELFELINQRVAEPRSRYNELIKDKKYLREILSEGGKKAEAIATPVLKRVRKAVGVE